MNSANRQTSILYYLLDKNSKVTYKDLISEYSVSQKTICNDIKVLNQFLNENNLNIIYDKKEGFIIDNNNDDFSLIDSLKDELATRFVEKREITKASEVRARKILPHFFASKNYITVSTLSKYIFLSERTVNSALKEVKEILSFYDLRIVNRPRYGMKIIGEEDNIRYANIDALYGVFYSLDNISITNDNRYYNVSTKEIDDIGNILKDYLIKNNIKITYAYFRRATIMLIVSAKRFLLKCYLKTNKKKINTLKQFNNNNIDELIDEVLVYFDIDNNLFKEDERAFIEAYLLICIDYSDNDFSNIPVSLMNKANDLLKEIMKELRRDNIVSNDNYDSFKTNLLLPSVLSVLKSEFKIIDYMDNSSIRKISRSSPLCASIAGLCFKITNKFLNNKIGDVTYYTYFFSLYSCIREYKAEKNKWDIAIFSPVEKKYSLNVKNRILDRYEDCFNRVDIIDTYDLFNEDLSKYKYIIYYEKNDFIKNIKGINTIKIDYFFNKIDSNVFYETFFVTSTKYNRAFSLMYEEDVERIDGFTDLEDIKNHLRKYTNDSNILKQIDNIELSINQISNLIFTITLYSNNDTLFNKIIVLDKVFNYRKNRFNKIYVFVINLSGNMQKIKTSEKIMRNMITLNFFEESIFNKKAIDFYDYYTTDLSTPLLKKKEG